MRRLLRVNETCSAGQHAGGDGVTAACALTSRTDGSWTVEFLSSSPPGERRVFRYDQKVESGCRRRPARSSPIVVPIVRDSSWRPAVQARSSCRDKNSGASAPSARVRGARPDQFRVSTPVVRASSAQGEERRPRPAAVTAADPLPRATLYASCEVTAGGQATGSRRANGIQSAE